MFFNKDSFKRSTPLDFYVCRPNNQTIAPVIGYENDSMTLKLLDISELSFEVPEYIYLPQKQTTLLNPCFNYLSQYMRIKDSQGRIFRINSEPEIHESPNGRIKSVTADSLECELQDKDIRALAVNMGNELSREWYPENLNALGIPINYITFVNDKEPRLSLMHILLEYAPNWKIGHIDTELRALRRSFEIDGSDLYAVLTQDVAKAFECVFLFDTASRTINACKVENLGKDTHIYLSIHNLITNQVITPSSDSIYTQFTVLADSGKDILPFANFGSSQISNYDYFLNPIWFDEAAITKYNTYKANVDAKRARYIELTKSWNYLNSQVSELYDRVPDSRCETAWTGLTLEELQAELESSQSAAALLRELHTSDGILQIENTSDYGIYASLTEVIIPKLEAQIEAVKAGRLTPEKELSWETNWNLYGINELNNKLIEYSESTDIYKDWAAPYNPDIHTENEALYNQKHKLYLEKCEYVRQIREAITARENRVSELRSEMDSLQAERKDITAYVQMDSPVHGFTSEELKIFESLTVHTDYENENILVTDFDDTIAQVDLAEELYHAASEQLAIESRPQLSMKVDLDSFLSMSKYNSFTNELEVGNFIRVGMNSEKAEKLRIVSIDFQPSDLSNKLNLEFSSMVTTYNRRDDYTYLTGNNHSGSGKHKITAGISSEDLTTALSTLLNSKFASLMSSPMFENAAARDIQAALGVFDVALADYLKTKDLSAEVADISKLSADSAFITYLQTQFASLTELDAAKVDVEQLIADYGNIKTLLSGSATTGSLHTIILNAENASIDSAYLKDLIAEHITVNDLKAGNINTDVIGLASGDDSLHIRGAAMQFSDASGVRLQLGKDAQGNFTFILRGADTSILIDEKGIHENAITDGLIKNRMVDNKAIDTSKVDWTSAGAVEEKGKPIWKSHSITVDEDGTTLTEKISTIQTNMDTNAKEINQLISDTTITKEDGTTVSIKDDYNFTKDTVNSHSQILSTHETQINRYSGEIENITSQTHSIEDTLTSHKRDIDSIAANATSAESKASKALQDLDGFKTTVSQTYSSKEEVSQLSSAIEQTSQNITQKVSDYYIDATLNASLLANMAFGKSVYINPTFNEKTLNAEIYPDDNAFESFTFLKKYKCLNTTASVIENDPTTPVQNGYTLKFFATGWNTPSDKYIGGISFNIIPRYNAKFIGKFTAKIPAGFYLECKDTIGGTSPSAFWLGTDKSYGTTSNKSLGTGKWEDYYYYIECDSEGTLGSPETSLLYNLCLSGEATPTPLSPVAWYMCYAEIFDITNITGIEGRFRKTESEIQQTKNSIQKSISEITVNREVLDDDGSETGKSERVTIQEMFNSIVNDLNGTKSTLAKKTETIENDVKATTQEIQTMSKTVESISNDYEKITEKMDGAIERKLTTYSQDIDKWMANFQKALTNKFTIKNVKVQYYASDSDSEPTNGEWKDSPCDYIAGKYYWQKIITTFSDDITVNETVPVLLNYSMTHTPTYIRTVYALSDAEEIYGFLTDATEECPKWLENNYIWTQTIFASKYEENGIDMVEQYCCTPIKDESWKQYNEKIGQLIGSTIANATISSDGFMFNKEGRSTIINTDKIAVEKDNQLLFGISEQNVTAGRLHAPDGADFKVIKIKPMPNVVSDNVILHGIAFVKSGGTS